MGETHEKIEFELGITVEQAINKLLDYKKNGVLVYGRFNGANLYSDTVTLDSAYRDVLGMSKVDFDIRFGYARDM